MNWSTLFFIIQILIALAVGAYAAFRLQDIIRSLVVRSMPVEKRISEQSFDIQTRYSTIIAFVIFFLVSGLVYWGIHLGKAAILPKAQQYETLSFFTPAPSLPSDKKEEKDVLQKPIIKKNILLDTIRPVVKQQIPKTYEEPQITGHYYLQLGAFNSAKAALAQARQFQSQLEATVQVVVIPHTKGPNKILVGSFSTRMAVSRYRLRKNLVGFVRKME